VLPFHLAVCTAGLRSSVWLAPAGRQINTGTQPPGQAATHVAGLQPGEVAVGVIAGVLGQRAAVHIDPAGAHTGPAGAHPVAWRQREGLEIVLHQHPAASQATYVRGALAMSQAWLALLPGCMHARHRSNPPTASSTQVMLGRSLLAQAAVYHQVSTVQCALLASHIERLPCGVQPVALRLVAHKRGSKQWSACRGLVWFEVGCFFRINCCSALVSITGWQRQASAPPYAAAISAGATRTVGREGREGRRRGQGGWRPGRAWWWAGEGVGGHLADVCKLRGAGVRHPAIGGIWRCRVEVAGIACICRGRVTWDGDWRSHNSALQSSLSSACGN
jgi:hypothetical protein